MHPRGQLDLIAVRLVVVDILGADPRALQDPGPGVRIKVDMPAEAGIVMAASYSDEVAGILRRQFSPQIKIAILRDFGLEMVGA